MHATTWFLTNPPSSWIAELREEETYKRMIASLEKLIDWSSVQVMTLMMPAKEYDWRLEEALRFLQGPDFVPTDSQPAPVKFNGPVHFRFPTPRPCDFSENNVVHGRLYRCSERWQERPVIIFLPGYNDSASYQLRFPLLARRCNRAGFNVATLVAPYHFQRRPRQRGAFDSGDFLLLAERTAQRSEEHTSELQSRLHLVCRLLLEKNKLRARLRSF